MRYNSYIQKYLKAPENLNLEELRSIQEPTFRKGKYSQFHALLVIDKLMRKFHASDYAVNLDCSFIHSKKMEKLVYNYKDYIDWFKRTGVLISVVKHSKRNRPKGYRLTERYYNAEIVNIPLTDPKTMRHLKKVNKNIISTSFIDKHPHLFKGFNEKLRIDSEKVLKLATELKKSLYKANGVVDSISNHDYYFKVDNFGGRFYNSISTMPKIYRKYLTYDSSNLASLDIKNSHAYLLNLLLKNNSEHISPTPPPPYLSSEKNIEIDSIELSRFQELTTDGKIYENIGLYMVNNFGLNFIHRFKIYSREKFSLVKIADEFPLDNFRDQSEQLRAISKRIFMIYMYGETKHSKISQYFLDNFPSINKFIEELKEVNGYIFLSQELNRIEAHLVLDVISAEFCQENPKAIVYTIHDNIATQIAYIDVLRAKAVEVFSRYLPKAPKFHIEYWCEECSDELKMVA